MKISMVITTMDRGDLLERSLSRLEKLTLPDQIVIVNDGGTDNTGEIVEHFARRVPIEVLYLYNHNPGQSICSLARNIGVKRARHEWIVTSEPELIYVSDIIAQFKELHEESPNHVISAGRVYFQPPGTTELTNDEWEIADGWVAPHTALWNREWLTSVGGWDEGFPGPWGWDDTDLLTRLRLAGHGQHIALDCVASHQYHGLGVDAGQQNEQHFLAKSFHRDENDLSDLVANKGVEWGQLRTRAS